MQTPWPFSPFNPEGHSHDTINKRKRSIPIRFIIPNFITIMAICAGVSSIRLAFEQRFDLAVFMVLVAAILDGVDGRIARMVKGSSPFGAQMDSLADVVNFGVAPALIVYAYVLDLNHQIGWVAVLIYCVACCLRLARFNVMLEDHTLPHWKLDYFVGVPAPAGALLVLLPVYMGLAGVAPNNIIALLYSIYVVLIALLLVCRLPVWNAKRVGANLRRDLVIPILLFLVGYIGFLANYTWQTLTLSAGAYLVFLPLSLWAYKRRQAIEAMKANAA